MDRPDDLARIEALEAEVERLRVDLERQRRLGRQAAHEARALDKKFRDTHERLTTTRRQMREFAERRSVRLAVDVSDRTRGFVKGIRRRSTADAEASRPAHAHAMASEADRRRFVARALDPHIPSTEGPLVSIVLLNRDGETHLRRCLPVLAATAYRDVELIVVDNGSTDGSLAILEAFQPGFPVRIIRNTENATFSAGNDQGAAEARGELLLFLNNDIEPLDPRWLGLMVETATASEPTAVGARLVYPPREVPLAGKQFADLSLQHGGVGFRLADGAALPVPLGAGEDAGSAWAMGVREVPALTAACLLVSRAAFEAVGGFSDGYVYGQEDVDLCLKLRDHGVRLVYDGRAALWHHESSTRNLRPFDELRARSQANRDHFVGIWGPRLYRTVLGDAIRGDGTWTKGGFRLVVVGSAEAEPIVHDGWVVTAAATGSPVRSDAADAVLITDPAADIRALPEAAVRIGWAPGPIDAWLDNPAIDDLDIVAVAEGDQAEAFRRHSRKVAVVQPGPLEAVTVASLIQDWLAATRVGIRIAVPSWDVASGWGDLYFARDLQRALERAGFPSRVRLQPEWDSWAAARDQVGIHLLGRGVATKRPGRLEIMWHISHPDAASVETYEAHDLVLVASDSFAAWMGTQVSIPVRPFHQATDPERFHPGMSGPHHELLFVANSRGVRRHILDDLLPTDHELAVYGKAWTPERIDQRFVAGTHVPNDEVGGYYASADIVLNDHWPDMQREGFLSNRLYDASAAGGFVISDGIEGLAEEFDGGVVSYESPAELRMLIERFLADPGARREYATRGRAAVLARHTFDHRVRELIEHIGPWLAARPSSFERVDPRGEPIPIER
jgi:GT2 family glycosyltransferase